LYENGLEVDDWRAVDHFEPLHLERAAVLVDRQNRDPVEPDRIRPIRRARGEYAG